MGYSEWTSIKICAHRKESDQDSEGGTQEPQAGAEQATKKLPHHTTPHSTTRTAPATALFGRPMKTKLPEVTTHCHTKKIISEACFSKATF